MAGNHLPHPRSVIRQGGGNYFNVFLYVPLLGLFFLWTWTCYWVDDDTDDDDEAALFAASLGVDPEAMFSEEASETPSHRAARGPVHVIMCTWHVVRAWCCEVWPARNCAYFSRLLFSPINHPRTTHEPCMNHP